MMMRAADEGQKKNKNKKMKKKEKNKKKRPQKVYSPSRDGSKMFF